MNKFLATIEAYPNHRIARISNINDALVEPKLSWSTRATSRGPGDHPHPGDWRPWLQFLIHFSTLQIEVFPQCKGIIRSGSDSCSWVCTGNNFSKHFWLDDIRAVRKPDSFSEPAFEQDHLVQCSSFTFSWPKSEKYILSLGLLSRPPKSVVIAG